MNIEDTREPGDYSEMICAQCGNINNFCRCPEGPDHSEYQCFECGEYLPECECEPEREEGEDD